MQADSLPSEAPEKSQEYLPGEFQGQRRLASYSPWYRKATEQLTPSRSWCVVAQPPETEIVPGPVHHSQGSTSSGERSNHEQFSWKESKFSMMFTCFLRCDPCVSAFVDSQSNLKEASALEGAKECGPELREESNSSLSLGSGDWQDNPDEPSLDASWQTKQVSAWPLGKGSGRHGSVHPCALQICCFFLWFHQWLNKVPHVPIASSPGQLHFTTAQPVDPCMVGCDRTVPSIPDSCRVSGFPSPFFLPPY